MKLLGAAILLVALVVLASACHAASISYDLSKAPAPTDWVETFMVPKFNPALGTLNSVEFWLTGSINGSVQLESTDAEPAIVTGCLRSVITLERPDGTTIVTTAPIVPLAFAFSEFDGSIDFGGTSGVTLTDLTSSLSVDTHNSPPPASDLALFTASAPGETISLGLSAVGASSSDAAGNVLRVFRTSASADVRVKYNYTAIPELPASALALIPGLLGLVKAGVARRRR